MELACECEDEAGLSYCVTLVSGFQKYKYPVFPSTKPLHGLGNDGSSGAYRGPGIAEAVAVAAIEIY